MRAFKFEKDPDSRWYVILPEWTGERAELEMVLGADELLNIISQGEDTVSLFMSGDYISDYKCRLIELEPESGGMWYHAEMQLGIAFPIWLCHVTKFVFGEFPDQIYLKW